MIEPRGVIVSITLGARRTPARALSIAALILAAAVFLPASALGEESPGDKAVESLPENHDMRMEYWDSLITAPKDSALGFRPVERTNPWASWRIYTERTGDAFYAVLSPRRDGAFPVHAQGSWVVKRSLMDGSLQQAKIFLRSDAGTFARIYPNGARSRMDIVVYGAVLYREVPLPMSLETVLRSPFSRLRELSAALVDWNIFSPDPALYGELGILMDAVRSHLHGLRYADDGAIDADGRAVNIRDLSDQQGQPGLNCSGFVKWLVDGMLKPLSGSYSSVETLKERMLRSEERRVGKECRSGWEADS